MAQNAILLVGKDDLLIDFLGRFSPQMYNTICVATPDEVTQVAGDLPIALLVIAAEQLNIYDDVLDGIRASGGQVLAVGEGADTMSVDRVVLKADSKDVIGVAAEMLEDEDPEPNDPFATVEEPSPLPPPPPAPVKQTRHKTTALYAAPTQKAPALGDNETLALPLFEELRTRLSAHAAAREADVELLKKIDRELREQIKHLASRLDGVKPDAGADQLTSEARRRLAALEANLEAVRVQHKDLRVQIAAQSTTLQELSSKVERMLSRLPLLSTPGQPTTGPLPMLPEGPGDESEGISADIPTREVLQQVAAPSPEQPRLGGVGTDEIPTTPFLENAEESGFQSDIETVDAPKEAVRIDAETEADSTPVVVPPEFVQQGYPVPRRRWPLIVAAAAALSACGVALLYYFKAEWVPSIAAADSGAGAVPADAGVIDADAGRQRSRSLVSDTAVAGADAGADDLTIVASQDSTASQTPDNAVAEPVDAGSLSPRARARLRRQNLMRRATWLLKSGDHKKAREALSKALEMRDDFRVRLLLADSHERAKEYWSTIHHLNKAIVLGTNYPSRAREKIGELYIKLGKRSKGCIALRKAAEGERASKTAADKVARFCQ